jgi:2-isopropylmalate synthase
MHIDGVMKSPRTFEHVSPESVGNLRNIVISSLSGRSAMADKMASILPQLDRESPEVTKALKAVREKEALGYSYEDAEGSLALVIKDALGLRKNFFDLVHFKVMTDEDAVTDANDQAIDAMRSTAMIKISVDGKEKLSAAEGNGPVNAMDKALRQVLSAFYPVIDKMKLTDFKVRVSSGGATASVVRVIIESTDGRSVWRTVGVSPDIINASWQALRDSVEYMLDMNN